MLLDMIRSAISGKPASPSPISGPMTPIELAGGVAQPTQQQAPQGLLGKIGGAISNPDTMGALAMGFNSMRLRPDSSLPFILNQQRQGRVADAERQKAVEQQGQTVNRTVEFFREKGREDVAAAIEANPSIAQDMLTQHFQEAKVPNLIAEYEYAVNQGYQGSLAEYGESRRGGVNVNLPSQVGAPPTGYQNVFDDQGRLLRQDAIPGGPAEREIQEGEEKQQRARAQAATEASTAIQDLGRASTILQELGPVASRSGVAGAVTRKTAAKLPGTPEFQAQQLIDSAKANIGINTLNQMRQNSPTGGALGNVTEKQLEQLQSVLGTLNIEQDASVVDANIKRVQNIFLDLSHGTRAEREKLLSQGRITQAQFDQINSLYQDLPFDSMGRPSSPSRGPVTTENATLEDLVEEANRRLGRR